jgi:hypothetical protein
MTRVRKLAVAISKWVCRNAPAGAKDWGAASERELEHIQSDWEALRWAIGSTTVLLAGSRVAPPITSVGQVPGLASCAARQVRRRTIGALAIVLLESFWWVEWFKGMQGAVLKAGCCLIVVAMALFAVQAYLRRWRGMPGGSEGAAMVAPLRAELVRQREFHSGAWLASRVYALMPGFLLICCGVWTSEPTVWNAVLGFTLAAAFALAATVGTRLQLRTADAFQRQIDALDTLAKG